MRKVKEQKVWNIEGVFLVTATIVFVYFERDLSMNTDS